MTKQENDRWWIWWHQLPIKLRYDIWESFSYDSGKTIEYHSKEYVSKLPRLERVLYGLEDHETKPR